MILPDNIDFTSTQVSLPSPNANLEFSCAMFYDAKQGLSPPILPPQVGEVWPWRSGENVEGMGNGKSVKCKMLPTSL